MQYNQPDSLSTSPQLSQILYCDYHMDTCQHSNATIAGKSNISSDPDLVCSIVDTGTENGKKDGNNSAVTPIMTFGLDCVKCLNQCCTTHSQHCIRSSQYASSCSTTVSTQSNNLFSNVNMVPMSAMYKIFDPNTTPSDADVWPHNMAANNFTASIENGSLIHESADSNYDSDEDSISTKNFVNKLVVDVVDSGNSTTPEDECDEEFLRAVFDEHREPSVESNCSNQATPVVVIDGQTNDVDEDDDDDDDDESINQRKIHKSKRKNCNDGRILQSQHEEIDRTISETLSLEYSEYVTHEMITKENNQNASKCNDITKSTSSHVNKPAAINIDEDLKDPIIESLYRSKLEYALKLDYSEFQVRQAIIKLGYDCQQNDFLNELLKIASTIQDTKKPSISTSQQCSRTLSSPTITVSNGSALLRSIVIDGSNVAMRYATIMQSTQCILHTFICSHGNREYFSCRGIQICVDWFRSRGHQEIYVFVPKCRNQESEHFDVPVRGKIEFFICFSLCFLQLISFFLFQIEKS